MNSRSRFAETTYLAARVVQHHCPEGSIPRRATFLPPAILPSFGFNVPQTSLMDIFQLLLCPCWQAVERHIDFQQFRWQTYIEHRQKWKIPWLHERSERVLQIRCQTSKMTPRKLEQTNHAFSPTTQITPNSKEDFLRNSNLWGSSSHHPLCLKQQILEDLLSKNYLIYFLGGNVTCVTKFLGYISEGCILFKKSHQRPLCLNFFVSGKGTLTDNRKEKTEAKAFQDLLQDLKLGQDLGSRIEGLPGLSFHGEITWVRSLTLKNPSCVSYICLTCIQCFAMAGCLVFLENPQFSHFLAVV